MEVDPAIPKEIKTDPQRLSEILINLITNAVKYTFSGGITVQVKSIGL